MNLYTVQFWNDFQPGDFGGWQYYRELQDGIKMRAFRPEMGIGFFSPRGALLFDTRRKSQKEETINRAYFSKKNPNRFPTQHIAREHCTKVLHFTTEPVHTTNDVLALITFEGDIYILLEDLLRSLRIPMNSVINYETYQVITGMGTSSDYFVFSIIVVIPNDHCTGSISGGKSLYNNNGVLKIRN